MHADLLIHYAQRSTSPEFRLSAFVESEPRLTWTSLLLSDFVEAEVFLVGGTVRDILLGSLPKDIDLVIRGVKAEDLERWLGRQGAVQFVGSRFGTCKFTPHGCRKSQPIDIALPRKEYMRESHASARRDQAIQTDAFLPIIEDLSRRDFTMNAMAFDMQAQSLIDPYGGLQDLSHQLVRTVLSPEERFYEDATRILRGLRFASQLRFAIEEQTWQAMQDNLDLLNNKVIGEEGGFVYAIPREAIGKEFLLGFLAHPVHTLNLWDASGALAQLAPWLSEQKELIHDKGKTSFEQTKELLHLLHKPGFLNSHNMGEVHPNVLVAALGVFASEREQALHLCRNFFFHQFSPDHPARIDCAMVRWLLDHLDELDNQDPATMRPSHFEKNYCTQRGQQLLTLIHAVKLIEGTHNKVSERLLQAKRLYEHYCAGSYAKLICGNDLLKLGLLPGPRYRELMDLVRDAQLIGQIHTHDQAIAFLEEKIARLA